MKTRMLYSISKPWIILTISVLFWCVSSSVAVSNKHRRVNSTFIPAKHYQPAVRAQTFNTSRPLSNHSSQPQFIQRTSAPAANYNSNVPYRTNTTFNRPAYNNSWVPPASRPVYNTSSLYPSLAYTNMSRPGFYANQSSPYKPSAPVPYPNFNTTSFGRPTYNYPLTPSAPKPIYNTSSLYPTLVNTNVARPGFYANQSSPYNPSVPVPYPIWNQTYFGLPGHNNPLTPSAPRPIYNNTSLYPSLYNNTVTHPFVYGSNQTFNYPATGPVSSNKPALQLPPGFELTHAGSLVPQYYNMTAFGSGTNFQLTNGTRAATYNPADPKLFSFRRLFN